MLLRNKKTGGIDVFRIEAAGLEWIGYTSLKEFCEDYEDYEEPKGYWYIEPDGSIIQNHKPTYINHLLDGLKSINNYFETKKEAEKAVEKLKAWKRLKDKGFEFINFPYKKICKYDARTGVGNLEYQVKYYEELDDDLDLLFSGDDE